MKCVICKQGETHPGRATVPMQRGEATVVVKDVPAEVCENCGEFYLDEKVTKKLMKAAEQALKGGAEVEVIRFAA